MIEGESPDPAGNRNRAAKAARGTFLFFLGPGTEVYAGLLGALFIGVLFGRYVAPAGVLAELSPDELAAYLVPAIRAVLAPALAHAAAGGQ